jgi:hypothetical protein
MQGQSYITTNCQPASLCWCLEPKNRCFSYPITAGFLMWGSFSNERMGMLFARTIVSGPSQRSHSRAQVP